jgi:3-carboxy-cis,cis-muconate cycloisomerase
MDDPLARPCGWLAALRPRVELVQRGGAVGDAAELGNTAPAVAAALAQQLGLGAP